MMLALYFSVICFFIFIGYLLGTYLERKEKFKGKGTRAWEAKLIYDYDIEKHVVYFYNQDELVSRVECDSIDDAFYQIRCGFY